MRGASTVRATELVRAIYSPTSLTLFCGMEKLTARAVTSGT